MNNGAIKTSKTFSLSQLFKIFASTLVLTASVIGLRYLGVFETTPKRKPGGQPGHVGKTRKRFGRVDRLEILRPEVCSCCGNARFVTEPIKIETQQVAQLVECPIEIVEYHCYTCLCGNCGQEQTADWSINMVPGQDLGIKLQAFLGWMNNYGHLPYEKQQELLWEAREDRNWGWNPCCYK